MQPVARHGILLVIACTLQIIGSANKGASPPAVASDTAAGYLSTKMRFLCHGRRLTDEQSLVPTRRQLTNGRKCAFCCRKYWILAPVAGHVGLGPHRLPGLQPNDVVKPQSQRLGWGKLQGRRIRHLIPLRYPGLACVTRPVHPGIPCCEFEDSGLTSTSIHNWIPSCQPLAVVRQDEHGRLTFRKRDAVFYRVIPPTCMQVLKDICVTTKRP